ncbi:uncharacterized protein BCR38DRAFT_505084 [Pseudomassariella vexata]|uniref:Uncharacterized protein n=1 Tax=Pseudomassariella vexata TaxID=1141098 RepID=A0A1Y2DBQ7_9PEZI|nr:uncharacterized protein BCR38DRAFT_505084 [Pseudomassariella vexata]ORY56699.1 hypothetical protein BCR38DRAFT_505084 [Pseudomassariella vexata]
MCVELTTFFGCDHREKHLVTCAMHHRRQKSLAHRLSGKYKGQRNCGSVRRQSELCANWCDHCAIRYEGLSTERVGHGASIFYQRFADKSFSEKQWPKEAARNALRKSELPSRSMSHNHKVVSSKSLFWIPGQYGEAKMAKKKRSERSLKSAAVNSRKSEKPADGKSKGSSSRSKNYPPSAPRDSSPFRERAAEKKTSSSHASPSVVIKTTPSLPLRKPTSPATVTTTRTGSHVAPLAPVFVGDPTPANPLPRNVSAAKQGASVVALRQSASQPTRNRPCTRYTSTCTTRTCL